MSQSPVRIVIAGGGTGGHVQPAIAVAETLREMTAVELTWIGSASGVEQQVAATRNIPFVSIPTGKLRRYLSIYTLTDAIRIPIGISKARLRLRELKPAAIYSTGGFVSVPTVIAGWMAGIPIITHEQTATVGLANRINARFADRIALAFESTAASLSAYRDRIVITGNPVRPELIGGDAQHARAALGLPDDLPIVYVTGGSLGAQAVNNSVRTLIPELLAQCNIIHQCGPSSANGDYPRLLQARSELGDSLQQRYVVRERVGDELRDIYAAADLVVGRAGAGTVAELALLGKPSILIPLPGAAGDEQTRNAQVLQQAGGSILLPQDELTPKKLKDTIATLLNDTGRLRQMSDAALTVAQPDAAKLLAREVLELAGG